MSTLNVSTEPLATKAWVENRVIYLKLSDGRIFGFPAHRFRRLKEAPDELLNKVEVEVNGYALRWEEIDEDITVPGIIYGRFELPPEQTRWATAKAAPSLDDSRKNELPQRTRSARREVIWEVLRI